MSSSSETTKKSQSNDSDATTTTTTTTTASTNTNRNTLSSSLDQSTLTLLEHVNLNVPNHDYILDFYLDLLGMGLDPRRAQNVVDGKGTVWVNCGASQFHLPYGKNAQKIPGHIGLVYNSLEGLKARVTKHLDEEKDRCFASCEIIAPPNNMSDDEKRKNTRECVKLVDHYGNVFMCRQQVVVPDDNNTNNNKNSNNQNCYKDQPVVSKSDTKRWGDVATRYGMNINDGGQSESECRGIEYVEFRCPRGTCEGIAQFYSAVFDATTQVVKDDADNGGDNKIAIIAIGNVHPNGRPTQSLLFREESNDDEYEYDGHHIALYVGSNQADFEQAFANAKLANVVWVNPRFRDDVMTLEGARTWKQFRFKDICNLKNGKPIFTLEHEMRSIQHGSWPGIEN